MPDNPPSATQATAEQTVPMAEGMQVWEGFDGEAVHAVGHLDLGDFTAKVRELWADCGIDPYDDFYDLPTTHDVLSRSWWVFQGFVNEEEVWDWQAEWIPGAEAVTTWMRS